MTPPVAFVLAGGQSRRFGSDKAQALVDGRPMLARVVAAARAVVDPVVVIGGQGPLPDGALALPDLLPGGGPVQAVVAATRAWPGRPWLLLGCDLPYLDPRLLQRLSRPLPLPALVRLPLLEGRAQYLTSFWSPAAAAAFEAACGRGEQALRRVAGELPQEVLTAADLLAAGLDPAHLRDVDTPADLLSGPTA
ncbi:MAG: NTP transferase domain-containing protein [Fimbriimonadaceae bacterium]|nr:NTP transferase domain-containing protein [Fimbriimonadaceae bacterium]